MLVPIIKQPIFEGTKKVLIYSLETGSDVEIRNPITDELLGKTTYKNNSLILELKRDLISADQIRATVIQQQKKVESEIYQVFSAPTAQVNIKTVPFFYAGAQCIRIWDILPFSRIEILDEAKNNLITYIHDFYHSVLAILNRPLTGGEIVTIRTELNNKINSNTLKIPVSTIPLEVLPAPIIVGPLHDCQNAIGLRGLFPGANVNVFADERTVCNSCAGGLEGAFGCVALKTDQKITSQQGFPNPPLASNPLDSTPEPVNPVSVKNPVIMGPIYDYHDELYIGNLEPGATIFIDIAEKDETQFTAVGKTVFANNNLFKFQFPFKKGQKIMVTQTFCGQSKAVIEEVIGLEDEVLFPKIMEPVFECTSIVRINPATKKPGSIIRIHSLPDKTVIGEGDGCIIPVLPLVEDQVIYAAQTAGGLTMETERNPVTVRRATNIEAPMVAWDYEIDKEDRYIDACRTNLRLFNLTPGTNVFVFARKPAGNKILVGSGVAVSPSHEFPIAAYLLLGWEIYAQAILCNLQSDSQISGKGTIVGSLHFDLSPSSFAGEEKPMGAYYIEIPAGKEITFSLSTKCLLHEDLPITVSFDKPDLVKLLGNADLTIPKNQKEVSIKFIANKNVVDRDSGTIITINVKLAKYYCLYGYAGGFVYDEYMYKNGYSIGLLVR